MRKGIFGLSWVIGLGTIALNFPGISYILTYRQLIEHHFLESVGQDTDYQSVSLLLQKSVVSPSLKLSLNQ